MSESSKESIPPELKIRKAVDIFRWGKNFVEHHHHQPLEDEKAKALYEKWGRRPINWREVRLLAEYERSELYQRYDDGEVQVLVLASGYDGIPANVFGKERITMLSLEASKYFSAYLTFLSGTLGVKKIEGNIFVTPLSQESFSLLLINDMDVFDLNYMKYIAPERNQTGQNAILEFFKEARRLAKSEGKLLITNNKNNAKKINKELEKQLNAIGWVLTVQHQSSVLEFYCFTAKADQQH